jgi:hypothetical protein
MLQYAKKDAIRTEVQGNLQVVGELKQLLGCLKKMAGVLHSFYMFFTFSNGTFYFVITFETFR